jgi:predicted small secreted protein
METKMKKYFPSIFALLLMSAFVLNISACNTMSGVGKDVTKAGDEITEEADEHIDND